MKRGMVKLLLSIFATACASVSLVASTFAYVLINNKVIVPDFDFNIKGQEGLQISLDNKNWSQDLLASQVKNHISNDFDSIRFDCVSIVQENGEIKVDDNNQVKFYYDKVNYDDSQNKYNHNSIDASPNSSRGYIKFDLYLRAKSTYEVKNDLNLKFTSDTNITSKVNDVVISNRLRTKNMENMENYITYETGSLIKVDVANAIRLGVYDVHENTDGELKFYNEFNVYEITNEYDLGSAALESHRGLEDKNDPLCNAMFTYYNNYFVKYPFQTGAEDGDAFNTKTRNDLLNANLGEFKFDSNKNESNVIKLEMYIWLEGWDADFFVGIPDNTTITCNFGFEII